MSKLPFRPLRPIRLKKLYADLSSATSSSDTHEQKKTELTSGIQLDGDQSITMRDSDRWEKMGETSLPLTLHTENQTELLPHERYKRQKKQKETPIDMISHVKPNEQARAEENAQAHKLLKRAPNNYLYNQIYGIWFYISSFLLIALITRGLGPTNYGVYAILQTSANTIIYIAAFGLEDALTTFVPRVLAEYGEATAIQLARYLLVTRIFILGLCVGIILFGLPLIANGIAMIPITGMSSLARGLNDPTLQEHSTPIAVFVLGSGLVNLLSALCSARMKTLIILILSGLTQLTLLATGYLLLQIGWGINGLLWMQATVSLLAAGAFALWQARPLLRKVTTRSPLSLRAIMQLSVSAWLTNLASGALLKQILISLLSISMISLANIGYFNLSFQLADSANVLLVSGFSGVGASALAVAFTASNYERLARTWQALVKIETLLAAPGLVFCLFNSASIVNALYGDSYNGVAPLLEIFLLFNLLTRLLGYPIHQSCLYVIGKPKSVVFSQCAGIIVVVLMGIVLIPSAGAAGALVADGSARTVTAIIQLLVLLRHIPKQYPQALVSFTLRLLAALTISALPGLVWHPDNRLLLGISGVAFILLCLGLLCWLKPLTSEDQELIAGFNPRVARYVRWFARS